MKEEKNPPIHSQQGKGLPVTANEQKYNKQTSHQQSNHGLHYNRMEHVVSIPQGRAWKSPGTCLRRSVSNGQTERPVTCVSHACASTKVIIQYLCDLILVFISICF